MNRSAGERGFCGAPSRLLIAKTMLLPWEEPCFGEAAGAIFFSGCSLGCIYCQNQPISTRRPLRGTLYSVRALADTMLELADSGATCIDLITPTHYADKIYKAIALVKPRLSIPVVWNTGGYELPEVIRRAAGLVDVFLTDFKYASTSFGRQLSHAADYPEVAAAALAEMYRTVGSPIWNEDRLVRGVVVRHLVLPGGRKDSIAVLHRIMEIVPSDKVLLSLMRQYTPGFAPEDFPALSRRVTAFEYDSVLNEAMRLGLRGFAQSEESATKDFTPDF